MIAAHLRQSLRYSLDVPRKAGESPERKRALHATERAQREAQKRVRGVAVAQRRVEGIKKYFENKYFVNNNKKIKNN